MPKRLLPPQDGLEVLDALPAVVRPKAWLALAALGTLTAGLVAWSLLARIPVTAQGLGVLARPNKLVALQAESTGRILDFRLQPGETVRVGEVVAVVDVPELTLQLAEQRAKVEFLTRQARQLQALRSDETERAFHALNREEQSLRRQLDGTRAHLPDLLERSKERRQLLDAKALPVDAYLEAEQAVRNAQERVTALEAQLVALDQKRAQLREQQASHLGASDLQLKEARAGLAMLVEQHNHQAFLRSNVAGRVLEVSANRGMLASPGMRLATITQSRPEDPLKAVIYFPVRDGKKARPGQHVQVTPDTVKRERYGGITGKVEQVSSFPVTRQAMATTLGNEDLAQLLGNGGPHIEVIATLDRDPRTPSGYHWTASKGPDFEQTSGTTLTARLTVDSLTPFQLAFSILKQASALY